ncbi:unnamed protein product, partial [Staurois parvus]
SHTHTGTVQTEGQGSCSLSGQSEYKKLLLQALTSALLDTDISHMTAMYC